MFRTQIREEIRKIVGEDLVFNVERPESPEHGDYSSNVALVLAQKREKDQKDITDALALRLRSGQLSRICEKVEVAGPGFLNFWISKNIILENLERVLKEKEGFGKSDLLAGKKAIVEYTDPNPFKEFHIGHLMSNSIGESLARIIEFNGAEVKRANYQGDVGMHIAYAVTKMAEEFDIAVGIEGYKKDGLGNDLSMEALGRKIFATYAAGVKKAQENKEFFERCKEVNKKIYEGIRGGIKDPKIKFVYDFGIKVSLEYLENVYGIIGMKKLANGKHFDFYFFESEIGEKGKEIVEKGLQKSIFEMSDGAVVFRGEKYGLHTRVFINSDGLPTYEAKELGLAVIKEEKYHSDISIVVTGNEIKEYFKVVLEAEKQLYPELAKKTKHMPHGMLRLLSGKMSSRTGDVITAEWLYEEVKSKLKERFQKNEKIVASEREKILDMVTLGAIKYSILRHSVGSDIVFDFGKSLAFEGDSGPYIQYVYARANSILEKARAERIAPSFANHLKDPSCLEKLILYFPEIVLDAHETLNPNIISRYLLELAGEFNNFYEKQKVLGVPESAYYVALTQAVSIVIQNGLNLLGISAPNQM